MARSPSEHEASAFLAAATIGAEGFNPIAFDRFERLLTFRAGGDDGHTGRHFRGIGRRLAGLIARSTPDKRLLTVPTFGLVLARPRQRDRSFRIAGGQQFFDLSGPTALNFQHRRFYRDASPPSISFERAFA